MDLKFITLLEDVGDEVTTADPYITYKMANKAINVLTNDSIYNEIVADLTTDLDGEIDLANLTYYPIRILDLYSPRGYSYLPRTYEYVTLMGEEGDRIYARRQNKLYVLPKGEEFTSAEIEFVATGRLIRYTGTEANWWQKRGVIMGSNINIDGSDDNDGDFSVSGIVSQQQTGWNQVESPDTVTDTYGAFPEDGSWDGKTCINDSDHSTGTIVETTATTITVKLQGGVDNTWQAGDRYRVIINENNTLSVAEVTADEAEGDTITVTFNEFTFALRYEAAIAPFGAYDEEVGDEEITIDDDLYPCLLALIKLYVAPDDKREKYKQEYEEERLKIARLMAAKGRS